MKYIKYILCALGIAAAAASCQKHEIVYYIDHDFVGDNAQFQIYYFEPVATNVSNAMDSIYINGKFVAGVGGYGQLAVKGVAPYGNTFYTAPAGDVSFQLYRGGNIVYDKTVNIKTDDEYEIYVYSLSEDPVVLPHEGEFTTSSGNQTAANYDTDSLATYRFINFLYKDGAPYTGKLQYQYSNDATNYTNGTWHNLGEPVGFGEATKRCPAIVHKVIYNNAGYQTLRFRCVDEDGNFIATTGDYWTSYIGRAYTHVIHGILGHATIKPSYAQFSNNS